MEWNTPNVKQNWSWYQMGPMYVNYAYRYGLQAYRRTRRAARGGESLLQLETELNTSGAAAICGAGRAVDRPCQPGPVHTHPDQYQQLRRQWTAQFITGQKSLDSDWNSYVQGVQNLGLSQYLATAQQAMGKPMDTLSGTLFKKDMAGIRLQSLKP